MDEIDREKYDEALRLAVMIKRYFIAMTSPIAEYRNDLFLGGKFYTEKLNKLVEEFTGEELTDLSEYEFIKPVEFASKEEFENHMAKVRGES